MDVQSFFIYTGLLIIAFSMAGLASKTNKKTLVWLIVIALSMVSGLRADTVGIDTKAYFYMFEKISNRQLDSIYGVEQSFKYICMFILNIWDNEQFLLFVLAFVTYALILFRLWEARDYCSFPWSVLCFYISFFGFSMNGIRQFVALAFIFYGSKYVITGKYVRFLLFVLIASAFHISALIGLLYIPIETLFLRRLIKGKKKQLLLFFLLFISILPRIYEIFVTKYMGYFDAKISNIGFMIPFKWILLLITAYVLHCDNAFYSNKQNDKSYSYIVSTTMFYYFIGSCFTSLTYFFAYTGRIGIYFYICEAVYFGILCKSTKFGLVFKWCCILLFGYIFLNGILRGTNGELPYLFFWQKIKV